MTATRWREKRPDMNYYTQYFEGIVTLIAAFQASLTDDVRQSLDGRLKEFEALYKASV
jgi:hypothetical protein